MAESTPEHLAELAELDADSIAKIGEYADALESEAVAKAAELAEAQERIAELEKGSEQEAEDDPLAKADPAVRKAVEDAQARADEAVAKAEAAEARERAGVFKSRAAAMPRIFGEDEGGELLRKAADGLGDDYDELERILLAADEKLSKSELLQETGEGGKPTADSAIAKINDRAAALQEAKPELTRADAISEVNKADPELYEQYKAEQREAAHN